MISYTRLVQVYIWLILIAPAFQFGVRSIYLAEIFLLILPLIMAFSQRRWIIYRAYFFFLCLAILLGGLLYYQATVYGHLLALDVLRLFFPFFVLFLFLPRNLVSYQNIINTLIVASLTVAGVGILQAIDGLMFSNNLSVNEVLARWYPYPGELTASGLEKAGGVQLKLSSVPTATSTFDGHPILLGDFLVFTAILCLINNKRLPLLVVCLAALCTFSRGAWAAILAVIVFHLLLFERGKILSKVGKYSALVLLGGSCVLAIPTLRDYVVFRVMNTLAVFNIVHFEGGNNIDPRTERVWPRFLEHLNDDLGRWIFGAPFDYPTDSGYLSIIQNAGIMGAGLVLVLLCYIYFFIVCQRRPVILVYLGLAFLLLVHPVLQGYRTVHFFAVILFAYSLPVERRIY